MTVNHNTTNTQPPMGLRSLVLNSGDAVLMHVAPEEDESAASHSEHERTFALRAHILKTKERGRSHARPSLDLRVRKHPKHQNAATMTGMLFRAAGMCLRPSPRRETNAEYSNANVVWVVLRGETSRHIYDLSPSLLFFRAAEMCHAHSLRSTGKIVITR